METNRNIKNNNRNIMNLNNISSDFDFKHDMRQIYAVILGVIAFLFILRLAINDSTVLTKNTYTYIVPIIFILFCVFTYFLFKFDISERSNSYTVLFIAFLIIVIIAISVYSMQKYDIFKELTPELMINILLLFIILLGLAIFYILFFSKISSHGSWTGFIINFLFYIPCLVGDAFNYILRDFATTPTSIFHLLFAELVMLFIYLYLYPKIKSTPIINGVPLIENPIMLNTQTRIDAPLYKLFFNKTDDSITNKVTINSPIRTTYSISMWIFLNVQSFQQLTHKNELSLFDYSGPDPSGCSCMSHPKVAYLNDRNGSDNYIFYLAPNQDLSGSIIYKKSLPHQKWNNLVFNYRDGAVDIFINAVLETPIKFGNTFNLFKIKNRKRIKGSFGIMPYFFSNATFSVFIKCFTKYILPSSKNTP